MRNVLLVTFYFPPYSHPGVQRPLKLAKYLPEFGYRPVVLTCGNMPWSSFDRDAYESEVKGRIEVHAADAPRFGAIPCPLLGPRIVEKLVLKAESLLFEDRLDWSLAARREAVRLVREKNIQLVWTTGPPQSVHFVGNGAKNKAGVPWVIDLRDPMVGYPADPRWSGLRRFAGAVRSRTLFLHWERAWVSAADAVTVVTEPMAEDLRSRHPAAGGKVTTITNGFDEADFAGVTPRRFSLSKFTITYTGRFWRYQTPTDFVEGLKAAVRRAPELREKAEVVFVGEPAARDVPALTAPELSGVVRLVGHATHRDAIGYQLGSDVNLLIAPASAEAGRHILTGKLFEYVRAGRPILAVVPDGAARDFVEAHRLGLTVRPDDRAGIADGVGGLFERWKAGALGPLCPPRELLDQCNYRLLAGALAAVFDRCLGHGR